MILPVQDNFAKILLEVVKLIVYTFWEPREKIPYYLQLCMETWKKFLPNAEIILLDYKNIGEYIDMNVFDKKLLSGRFSLPKIADAIRVALIAKHGGVWMDVDTIILNSNAEKYFLPDEKNRAAFFGSVKNRGVRICFINTPPETKCMNLWLEFIQERIRTLTPETPIAWNFLGNSFISNYSRQNPEEIKIFPVRSAMPQLKILSKEISYRQCDNEFFFAKNLHLSDIKEDLALLHNSWTPRGFKKLSPEDFLRCDCTMTNVLAEILELKIPPPNERLRFKDMVKK